MENYLSKTDLLEAARENEWDFGNNQLYDLCSAYPDHKKTDIVVAKILFIGRIYAAAIERRKNKTDINDDFYIDKVAPAIISSQLDSKLQGLDNKELNEQNISDILALHKYLSDLFNSLTGLNKRSLSSKYLHFHKPHLFFIYDSRAMGALRSFISRIPLQYLEILKNKNIDLEYGKFFVKAYTVKNNLEEILGTKLTLRQFDKILISKANKNLVKK
ncbi:MAG: hypothetical protein Q8M71_11745 [Thermodesulfovibrionales bacterium]|nr:hypothetical protein [Thermodesulfovibrionales bacterium]